MTGFVYCMQNTHKEFRNYLKIGYTNRRTEIRRVELCGEFHCNFETLWDIEVYDAAKAEFFLHETLYKCRVRYEFFRIDSERARQLAERFFDLNWRDIEGMDKDRPNLVELANLDAQGILMESDVSFDSDDGRVRQTKDDEPNF